MKYWRLHRRVESLTFLMQQWICFYNLPSDWQKGRSWTDIVRNTFKVVQLPFLQINPADLRWRRGRERTLYETKKRRLRNRSRRPAPSRLPRGKWLLQRINGGTAPSSRQRESWPASGPIDGSVSFGIIFIRLNINGKIKSVVASWVNEWA